MKLTFLTHSGKTMWKVFIVAVLLVLITLIVYVTGGASEVFVHLYYVPIMLGGLFWFLPGGAVTGLVAGILTGPVMAFNTQTGAHQSFSNWSIRIVFFVIMGIVAGAIFRRLYHERRILEQQNDRLMNQQVQLEQQRASIESFGTDLIETLAKAIELRDPYTNGHCDRVAQMSLDIGHRLGLPEEELLHLRWAALIHDVGKIGIPESILNKPARLTDDEYEVVKEHPLLGQWALQQAANAKFVVGGVTLHHERWDGRGYPYQLKGPQIPLQARIISVADVWDAVTSDRPYRPALGVKTALNIMKEGRGTQFDPEILDTFLRVLEDCGQDELTSGL